jgi:hypothetical protein
VALATVCTWLNAMAETPPAASALRVASAIEPSDRAAESSRDEFALTAERAPFTTVSNAVTSCSTVS